MKPVTVVASLSLALLLTVGASPPPSPDIRPVRTVVAKPHAEGESVSLTGHIRARTEESLAFRIDGRMMVLSDFAPEGYLGFWLVGCRLQAVASRCSTIAVFRMCCQRRVAAGTC